MLYNTLTRKKEKFIPATPPWVKMYVCGPTTYNYIHLGNARPLVVFDTLRRYLEYKGFQVLYVQNFTDIDDKVIRQAQQEGVEPLQLAQKYIEAYCADAQALNVKTATVHPRVTAHIPEIIDVVAGLIRKGYAYERKGNVYFAVREFPGYGKLSKRPLEEMRAGARVEIDPDKNDPLDFALWKASTPTEPGWSSPWGRGRPGWHIECAVMALKYLGPAFDIHAGGYDLVFPHHENEIAEAESFTGKPFARYWLHNGFITVKEEKMAKSKGNFFLVREILQEFPPASVRFYLLATHYRSPLDFDPEKLAASQRGLQHLESFARRLEEEIALPGQGESLRLEEVSPLELLLETTCTQFEAALDDDFNTASACATLFTLRREVNTFLDQLGSGASPSISLGLLKVRQVFYRLAGEVLGIISLPQERPLVSGQEASDQETLASLLALILDLRQEARQRKDWETADAIRRRLQAMGFTVEDTPQGPRYYRTERSKLLR